MNPVSARVAIVGGSGSGKTTLAQALREALGPQRALLLSHDAYYRDLSAERLSAAEAIDFDHPDALESWLLAAHLDSLGRGEAVAVPTYDFSCHRRAPAVVVAPRPVVLVEGILLLAAPELAPPLDLRVFVDAPAPVRLARRLHRDVVERGRDAEEVLGRWARFVEPGYQRFVAPHRARVQLVVDGERPVQEAVDRVLERLAALTTRRAPTDG